MRYQTTLGGCCVLALVLFGACGESDESADTGGAGGAAGGGGSSGGGTAGADASQDAVNDAPVGPPPEGLLYVSVGAEARLAVVGVSSSGKLSARSELDLTLPSNPGPLAWDAPRRRLYAALAGAVIATIDVDAKGAPKLVGTTPSTQVTEQAVYLSLSADGKRLAVPYYGNDLLNVHDTSGAPPHAFLGSVATADEPHCAVFHAGFVYVAHRHGESERWYSLTAGGAPSLAGELKSEGAVGPRHLAFSPSGSYAYVVHEFGGSVSAHTVAADGSLKRFQTVSILPTGATPKLNYSADIHVSPDGQHVYASNRGYDTVAVLDVASDGSLKLVDNVATENWPREFDLSASGTHLLVAGQGTGHVASYLVAPDGKLAPADRLNVGADLRWIVTVEQ